MNYKLLFGIGITLCLLSILTYLDYIYYGYKDLTGYLLTNIFEIGIFFIGFGFGEYSKQSSSNKEIKDMDKE